MKAADSRLVGDPRWKRVLLRVDAAAPEMQRRVAIAAAQLAIRTTELADDPAIARGLAAVESGSWGDTPARAGVDAVTKRYDDEYFELFDSEHGEQMPPFRRARAASALSFALDPDPVRAAADALYEAAFALDLEDDARLIALFPPGG